MADRHTPRKRFGQHFLVNTPIADRIVGAAELNAGETVLEIGSGTGVLTERLVGRAARVFAVEIDRDLIARLQERFGGDPSFTLIEGDVLAVDLSPVFAENTGRIVVVANIPYNISSPIIDRLIGYSSLISRAVLMVQREVAERLAAGPGSKSYGLTSLNCARVGTVEKVMDVRPGSFRPPPTVMSRVIRIRFDERPRHPVIDERLFRELTGAAFRQRRKMVRNTLVPWLTGKGFSREDAARILTESGIAPDVRPETLTVDSFARLADLVAQRIGEIRP